MYILLWFKIRINYNYENLDMDRCDFVFILFNLSQILFGGLVDIENVEKIVFY